MMKKRLRFQMPHVPLKVLRGQQDEEDIQDQYYERFQAPPGTSTEEEANALRRSSSSHWDSTTDIGNASESVGSIHSISDSNNDSDEGPEDVHIDLNNTGYQTTGSVSHEAIELQAFADVHQRPNTESDTTINTDNVSEEAMGRYLGRHISSIDNASQSDTAPDEAKELRGLAQVHQLPNADNDVASVGNVSEDAMQRYLGEHTGSTQGASQSNTASHEGVGNVHNDQINNTGYEATGSVSHEAIALQSFVQVHKPPNTESDVTINTDNVSEEAMDRYQGRLTSSIDNVSQSDTASEEDIGLQEFGQAHHPPNTGSDIVSISNINKEIMQRYLGEHTGSQHSTCQSDTASHEGVGGVHNDQINNTGHEATGSVSHEAIVLQSFAKVHQPPNTEGDTTTNTDNISEEAVGRYQGKHTGSVHSASQSDTASHESIELQALAQVNLPPNSDNVQDDALSFYDNVEYIKVGTDLFNVA